MVDTTLYFYDANGNVTKITYVITDEDGDPIREDTVECTYNDRGLVATESHVSVNHITPDYSMEYRYEYDYDKYGNIINDVSGELAKGAIKADLYFRMKLYGGWDNVFMKYLEKPPCL